MSEQFKGERTLMRIFVGESDHCPSGPYKGRPLFEALMLLLRDRPALGYALRAQKPLDGRGDLRRGILLDEVLRIEAHDADRVEIGPELLHERRREGQIVHPPHEKKR